MTHITCTLVRRGDKLLLPLPNELLVQLHLGEGEKVTLTVEPDSGRLIITPGESVAGVIDAAYARQIADFIAAYRPALEALAHSAA